MIEGCGNRLGLKSSQFLEDAASWYRAYQMVQELEDESMVEAGYRDSFGISRYPSGLAKRQRSHARLYSIFAGGFLAFAVH